MVPDNPSEVKQEQIHKYNQLVSAWNLNRNVSAISAGIQVFLVGCVGTWG